MRLDGSTFVVMGFALVSAVTTAMWLNPDRAPDVSAMTAVAVSAPASGQPAQVLKGDDGHYWANATVDGRAVRVMVDTGATVVALTRADAQRLGVDLTADDFNGQIMTAAGPTRAARVTLKQVSVAGAEVSNVEAMVVESGLPHSLLGMSYLGRLSAFTATPTALTLNP